MAQEIASNTSSSSVLDGYHSESVKVAVSGTTLKDSFLLISTDESHQNRLYATGVGDSTPAVRFHTNENADSSQASGTATGMKINDEQHTDLSEDEIALLGLLKQEEIKQEHVKQQEFATSEVSIPATRLKPVFVRTETQEIKIKYQKDNLSGPTLMHQREPIHSTQYSFEHFTFNEEEKRIREQETRQINSERLLDKKAYESEKQNRLYYRPSLSLDFKTDLQTLFLSKEENEFGYKKISMGGRDFYVTRQTLQKPLYKPVEAPKRITHGKTEKMIAVDDHFVALERAAHRGCYSVQDQQEMQKRLELFQDNPIIVKAWIVDSRLVIAEYGGTNVRKLHVREESKVQLKQYKPFLEFVTTLHANGGRLCCISNDNLLCPNDNGALNFTGWKYIATPDVGSFDEMMFDEYIYTQSLIDKTNKVSILEERKQWMAVAEKHAILLMVCEGTTPRLACAINTSQLRDCKTTILNKKNQGKFIEWITQHVHKKYRNEVILFLKDPVKHPLEYPVSEVLKL
ncbi:hypothetical protein L2734_06550 [Parashewanella spongiae]|nr:hypothetical protein [Parashewanella spongiae]MCL1077832.1 hypothetical protein [Parashewanella spongiae]